VPQQRPGKSPRPIVVAPIENRIVQRALLDVLQAHPPLKPYFEVATSYGGLKKKGAPDAIEHAYRAMESGANYFIRSDIQGFSTKIPKSEVLSVIDGQVSDAKLMELLTAAVAVELENRAELERLADLFPLYDEGVAQGSSLSPFLGNIFLNDFDREMNDRGITCLRYVDDFLLMGPNKSSVLKTFQSAQKWLARYSMNAYDPRNDKKKAEMGDANKGFTFLGCDIHPGQISPSRDARKRLLNSIEEVLAESERLMNDPKKLARTRRGLVDTLHEVSNVVRGWGNQYAFCNNQQLIDQLDSKISDRIKRYRAHYSQVLNKLQPAKKPADSRRLLGVHLLADSKQKPIAK
jgi:hypothetical protein